MSTGRVIGTAVEVRRRMMIQILQSTRSYQNSTPSLPVLTYIFRIAQIIHAYSKKKFHVRWFVHGSETLLEELAHGQELFLSVADSCEDISMEKFVAKCKVARISLEEHSRQKWPEKDTYFYWWVTHILKFRKYSQSIPALLGIVRILRVSSK